MGSSLDMLLTLILCVAMFSPARIGRWFAEIRDAYETERRALFATRLAKENEHG